MAHYRKRIKIIKAKELKHETCIWFFVNICKNKSAVLFIAVKLLILWQQRRQLWFLITCYGLLHKQVNYGSYHSALNASIHVQLDRKMFTSFEKLEINFNWKFIFDHCWTIFRLRIQSNYQWIDLHIKLKF